jgi:hypothetical protein
VVHDAAIRVTQLCRESRVNSIQIACGIRKRAIVIETDCRNDTLER